MDRGVFPGLRAFLPSHFHAAFAGRDPQEPVFHEFPKGDAILEDYG